ncbi:hypothetical protein [Neisseria iguanae]|nr:hypothetical protein [Neisseria iguanae]
MALPVFFMWGLSAANGFLRLVCMGFACGFCSAAVPTGGYPLAQVCA